MPPEKRNQFLDAGDSDDDGSQGYDSEAGEVTKGGRSAKRRKVQDGGDEGKFEEFEEEPSEGENGGEEEDGAKDSSRELKEGTKKTAGPTDDDRYDEDESDDPNTSVQRPATSSKLKPKSKSRDADDLPHVSKPLSKKSLLASEKAISRSGVIYISRVPPYLTPHKLRSLLKPYGDINRIFLSPENETARSRRIRGGGNKKKSFTDGWVEFVRKRDAKRAVDLLNAHTIGGKKGSWYRDDMWSLRYLNGFKWHHLTEQISAENAARASRMRAEISKTTRENMEFKNNVLQAKEVEGMQAKRAAKRQRDGAEDDGQGEPDRVEKPRVKTGPVRTFKQTPVAVKGREKVGSEAAQTERVLGKIF